MAFNDALSKSGVLKEFNVNAGKAKKTTEELSIETQAFIKNYKEFERLKVKQAAATSAEAKENAALKASIDAINKANREQAKAAKEPKRRLRRAAGAVARPLHRPARVVSWPFRLRPVRFIGRLLGRILWPKYFRNSFKEVRQVTWPSRRETWKLTFAVLIFALVFGLAAAGTDFVLDNIMRRIIFRS